MPTEVDKLGQGAEQGQIKAAISDCVATEMRNGKSQEQAVAMCMAQAKDKVNGGPTPQQEAM